MSATCEQCGRFEGVMEDPTFDGVNVLVSLWICEPYAKGNIETEMMRLGQVVN